MTVFFTDGDRAAYLEDIREACDRFGVEIWAYCLMSNHVHFVAVPAAEDSLARCFSEAHVHYTRRVNKREGWQGHLWQGRFGSSVLSEHHLLAAVRYIERNPVRAGMVKEAWDYPWSSAAYHTGRVPQDRLVGAADLLRDLVRDWNDYLQEKDREDFLKMVRRESFVNRPLGDESFVSTLEQRFGVKLVRGKSGRPITDRNRETADQQGR
jgi:putative transposase